MGELTAFQYADQACNADKPAGLRHAMKVGSSTLESATQRTTAAVSRAIRYQGASKACIQVLQNFECGTSLQDCNDAYIVLHGC